MKIDCLDNFGKKHTFDESEYVFRKSLYGMYIKDNSVVMVQDATSKKWEFPGGGIEEGETELAGFKREFKEETGMELVGETQLLVCNNSYFYHVLAGVPWKSERCFYRVKEIKGNIITQGNGYDVMACRFVPFDQIHVFPMDQEIREVFHQFVLNSLK